MFLEILAEINTIRLNLIQQETDVHFILCVSQTSSQEWKNYII